MKSELSFDAFIAQWHEYMTHKKGLIDPSNFTDVKHIANNTKMLQQKIDQLETHLSTTTDSFSTRLATNG